MTKSTSDISVDGQGIITIQSESVRGAKWMMRLVEGAARFSPTSAQALTDSERMAIDIAEGALQDGLTVRYQGREVELRDDDYNPYAAAFEKAVS